MMVTILDRILHKMEPGKDYTAAELAVITGQSRNVVGNQLRKAVADERVKIVGVATTGWRNGTGFIYRINKEDPKNGC